MQLYFLFLLYGRLWQFLNSYLSRGGLNSGICYHYYSAISYHSTVEEKEVSYSRKRKGRVVKTTRSSVASVQDSNGGYEDED